MKPPTTFHPPVTDESVLAASQASEAERETFFRETGVRVLSNGRLPKLLLAGALALLTSNCASTPRKIVIYPVVACDYRVNVLGHDTIARISGVGDSIHGQIVRCYSERDLR